MLSSLIYLDLSASAWVGREPIAALQKLKRRARKANDGPRFGLDQSITGELWEFMRKGHYQGANCGWQKFLAGLERGVAGLA